MERMKTKIGPPNVELKSKMHERDEKQGNDYFTITGLFLHGFFFFFFF